MNWPFDSQHLQLLAEADIDRLPTDSGEGYEPVSDEQAARAWAKRKEDGLKWELAWAKVSHLYANK